MRITVSLLLILLFTTACGKRGALIYPEMLAPSAPTDVSAHQTGSEVRISFQLPRKDIAGHSLSSLAGVNLFKQGSDTQPGGICVACSSQFSLFKTVYLDSPGNTVQRYSDRIVLLDGQVHPGSDYAYYLQSFLHDGAYGTASRPVKVSVVPAIEPPVLKAVSKPAEVRLELYSPEPAAGVLVGFAFYRTLKGMPFPYLPLTKDPVASSTYLDFGLQPQSVYTYKARTVVRMANGIVVESEASNEVDSKLSEE